MKAIKNKTRILKFLSTSLSIIMLLASLPNIVFAESTSLGSMSADSNASSGELVSISADGYTVSWSISFSGTY